MTAQGQNRLKTKGAIDLLILAIVAIISLAIPFTAKLVQQNQEVRKEAVGTCAVCEVYDPKTCYRDVEQCSTCYETCYEKCSECLSYTYPDNECEAWGEVDCNPYDCNPYDCNCETVKEPYECGNCEPDPSPACNEPVGCGSGDCNTQSFNCEQDGGKCEGTKPDCSCNYPPTLTPTPLPTDEPTQGCTNPSGQTGDSYCRGADLLTCVSRFGTYYWDGKTCSYGCQNSVCQDAPKATVTPVPTETIPTDIPSQGCTSPSGNPGDSFCRGSDLLTCVNRFGVYYWDGRTCTNGCSNNSCNTALSCDGKPNGTTECTAGQDSYNECNNGAWESYDCSSGYWCPAGGTKCELLSVSNYSGNLVCNENSPKGVLGYLCREGSAICDAGNGQKGGWGKEEWCYNGQKYTGEIENCYAECFDTANSLLTPTPIPLLNLPDCGGGRLCKNFGLKDPGICNGQNEEACLAYKTPACCSKPLITFCPAFGNCPKVPIGGRGGCTKDPSIWRCMPDGQWTQELFDPDTEKPTTGRSCFGEETGIGIDGCTYTCNNSHFQKDYPDCPEKLQCLEGSRKVDDNGCSYLCKGITWEREDPKCGCYPEGKILKINDTCSKTCLNNTWQEDCYFLMCQANNVVGVNQEGDVWPLQSCNKGCQNGKCLPEDGFCEGNQVMVWEGGHKRIVEICINGCESGVCKQVYYGSCKENEKMVLPNGCTYQCRVNAKVVYWDKLDPDCEEIYGTNLECLDKTVVKVKYGAVLDQKTEIVKSCQYGCLYGECTYPPDYLCEPGQRQFNEKGEIMECKRDGDITSWQVVDFKVKVIAPGLSSLERQTLYYTMADLPSVFWGKDSLEKIIITETYTEQGNKNANGYAAWYDSSKNYILLPDWALNDKYTIVHELTHSLQFQSTLMRDWETNTGWSSPSPGTTGLVNSPPGDVPLEYAKTNSLEDMAVAAGFYYSNPCELLKISPRRYEFLKNSPEIFNGKEYLPQGGCSQKKSSLPKKEILSSVLLTGQVLAQEKTKSDPLSLFSKIIPGKTTKEETERILGMPTKTDNNGDSDYYWYQAEDLVINQTIIFKNDIVYLMTLHLGNQGENKIKSIYGQSEKETYNYYRYDTKALLYPQKGLVFIVDQSGKSLVKQVFIPTSLENFLSLWGKEYPEEYPYEKAKIYQIGEIIPGGSSVDTQKIGTKQRSNNTPFYIAIIYGLIMIFLLKRVVSRDDKIGGIL